jgi:hypothetical protein
MDGELTSSRKMAVLLYNNVRGRRLPIAKYLLLSSVLAMVCAEPYVKTPVVHAIAAVHRYTVWRKCVNNRAMRELVAFTDDPTIYNSLDREPQFSAGSVRSWHFEQYMGEPWLYDVRNPVGVIFVGPAQSTPGTPGVLFLRSDAGGTDLPDERIVYIYGAWFRRPQDIDRKLRRLYLRIFVTKIDRITIYAGHCVDESRIDVPVTINGKWHVVRAQSISDDLLRVGVDGDANTDHSGMHDWHTEADTRLRAGRGN